MKAVLEQIRQPEEFSFAAWKFQTRRFEHPYHYHPEIELTLIERGHGQRLIGDHLGNFAPGDLVLMGSGLPHRYFHPPEFDNGPTGARSVVLQFRPDAVNGMLQHAPECRAIRALLQRAGRGLVVSPEHRPKAASLLKNLCEVFGPERLIRFLEILDFLSGDETALPLASSGFQPGFNQHQAQRIERACHWILARFREPITLEQAARQAHMTPGAFSRFFRRATNRNYVRFVNELRISHACRLLLETGETIAEIAFESGFGNLSNFNRRFREEQKMTPREYRLAARESERL